MLIDRRKFNRQLRRCLAVFAATSAWYVIRCLPWRSATRFGRWIGDAAYIFAGKSRRIAKNNIDLVFGSTLSESEKHSVIHRMFRNLGKSLMQCMKLYSLDGQKVCRLVDSGDAGGIMAASLENGRSVLLLTAHYSNWEYFAARLSYMAPISVVARKNNLPALESLIEKSRAIHNIKVLDRDDPSISRTFLRLSKEGGQIIGLLMDLDTRVKGVFSPFLGVPAFTPTGPATLAVKGWFDTYFGYVERLADETFKIKMIGPVDIRRTDDFEADIRYNTDRFNEFISKQILGDPSEWAWIHQRWRRKPETTG